jgi:hypothetical protein
MSKGSKRRPQQVTDKELAKNWKEIFDNFDPSKKQQILSDSLLPLKRPFRPLVRA